MNVIRSTAERSAAVEFAKAATTRPHIVGTALARVAKDPEISAALFELLETQNLLQAARLEVSIVPRGTQLIAAVSGGGGILAGQ